MSWTTNNDWLRAPPSAVDWRAISRFLRFYQEQRVRLLVTVLLAGLSAASLFILPLALRRLQVALQNTSGSSVVQPVLVLCAVLLLQPCTTALLRISRSGIASSLSAGLTQRFQQKLMEISLEEYFGFRRTTNIYQRVVDATNVTGQFTDLMLNVSQQVLTALAGLVIIAHMSLRCALILMAGSCLVIPVTVVTGRTLQKRRIAILAINFPLVGKLLEILKQLVAIKVLSATMRVTSDVSALLERKVTAERDEAIVESRSQSVVAILGVLTTACVVIQALEEVRTRRLSLSSVLGVYLICTFAVGALNEIAKGYLQLVSISTNVRNFLEVLSLPSEDAGALRLLCPSTMEQKQALRPDMDRGRTSTPLSSRESAQVAIRFEDVHFAYRDGPQVLKGVSFTVYRGEHVAFIGRSGSGKSTLLRLMLGLMDIQKGSISVPSNRVDDLSVSSHRRRFGVVTQDAALFEISLRDNLLLGHQDSRIVEDAAIWAALDQVGLKWRIHTLGHKLDEVYTDNLLSGGERQRVTIARALLRRPEFVMLDEPTSALDFESEAAVVQAVSLLSRERTTVTIAHRLSTIRSAQRVFVLDDGCILASGTHDELIASSAYYRSLCNYNSFIL